MSCDRRGFSFTTAKHLAKKYQQKDDQRRRVYRCPDCRDWHFTLKVVQTDLPSTTRTRVRRGTRLFPGESIHELAAKMRARACPPSDEEAA